MSVGVAIAEGGWFPDALVRMGIRHLCRERLADEKWKDNEAVSRKKNEFVQHMNESPIALLPEKANEQHYEVPSAFFAEALGPNRKYSCCHFEDGNKDDLEQAEVRASVKFCHDLSGVWCPWDIHFGVGTLDVLLLTHCPC